MPGDRAALLDMARAARLIIEFSRGLDEIAFSSDLKTQSAVLHQPLVLGEAVKRLSPDFRANHPSIPWPRIAGMRDRLIHGYDQVNMTRVWSTVVQDIPDVLASVEALLATTPTDEP